MCAPSEGTTRARGKPVAGCKRRPSLIHACKYGNACVSEKRGGDDNFDDEYAWSISSCSYTVDSQFPNYLNRAKILTFDIALGHIRRW